jgi:hypothetical protein
MTGFELKVERLRREIAQFRIAAALDVTPQFVSAIELQRKRMPAGFADRYLEALARLISAPSGAGWSPNDGRR